MEIGDVFGGKCFPEGVNNEEDSQDQIVKQVSTPTFPSSITPNEDGQAEAECGGHHGGDQNKEQQCKPSPGLRDEEHEAGQLSLAKEQR